MSVKSQESNMRRLSMLLSHDLSFIGGERECGPNGSKKAFLNTGKAFLRALARDLGLHDVTVSANSGGIAVSGECGRQAAFMSAFTRAPVAAMMCFSTAPSATVGTIRAAITASSPAETLKEAPMRICWRL